LPGHFTPGRLSAFGFRRPAFGFRLSAFGRTTRGYVSLIFFDGSGKILDSKDLGILDRGWSGQNLEIKGLAGKILRNKELAGAFDAGAWPDWLGDASRIGPILRFSFSSVKVVRHRKWLWKAVGKTGPRLIFE
jgi:hypothetical protein